MMDLSHYLHSIRERIQRFQSLPGTRMPLYEEHAAIDCGRYLCVVRNARDWSGKMIEDCPAYDTEARELVADHLIKSVQDIDELLAYIGQLETENRELRLLRV